MSNAYTPVACSVHDRYERALITGQPLIAGWTVAGIDRRGPIRAVRLETRNHEEFLVFTDAVGQQYERRLDHIRLKEADLS